MEPAEPGHDLPIHILALGTWALAQLEGQVLLSASY